MKQDLTLISPSVALVIKTIMTIAIIKIAKYHDIMRSILLFPNNDEDDVCLSVFCIHCILCCVICLSHFPNCSVSLSICLSVYCLLFFTCSCSCSATVIFLTIISPFLLFLLNNSTWIVTD